MGIKFLNKRALSLVNYLPGVIILAVSLFALNASVIVPKQNAALNAMYETSLSSDAYNIEEIMIAKESIQQKGRWLYWSVWVLGLTGFVLVLMNADKLRRVKSAKEEIKGSLALLEKQLEEIQKAESEKLSLQGQLYQAQKLEAIGRLTGGIAHDFNNILAAMNGYAEFLVDDLNPETPQRGYANNILSAGQQARELVDQMLAFSRRDREETQQMRISSAIQETLSMLNASLPKSIEVETDIRDENYIVHGNATMISQALMNLCVNAKDAMRDEKGALKIELTLADTGAVKHMDFQESLPATDDLPLIDILELDKTHTCLSLGKLAAHQEYLRLSVEDDGSGIGREVMESIFEPFFTTKPVDKGTGLGLAMVHGVVASHRGAMQINSKLGGGTRFDLYFPSLGEKADIAEINEIRDDWKAVGRILLVEDQEKVRNMMETMLERIGFEVEACDSAIAALEILREHPDYFNAVISDQNMPKMTGIELVEEIAIDMPDLPFVIVTGYSIEGMRDVMKENTSIKAILKKPIDRDSLREAIQTAILEQQFAA